MVAMVKGVSMVAMVASMENVVSIVATAVSMGNVSIVATVTNAPRRNAAGRASERERQRLPNNSPAPSVAGEPFFWRRHLPRMVDRQDRMAGLHHPIGARPADAERLGDIRGA